MHAAARRLEPLEDDDLPVAMPELPLGDFPAFTKQAAKHRCLAPGDDSPKAFIQWLALISEGGKWTQTDLYATYLDSCELARRKPLAAQVFSAALNHMGLKRGQLDMRRQGRRYRPTYYVIPDD